MENTGRMKLHKATRLFSRIPVLYPLFHGAVSLLFLLQFPFVHSDESWLSGLTRDMREARSLAVTESFFNAKVRYPHAIKSFYHLLQMAFMAVFGDSVFAVRLLSLVCGVLFLYLFYALLNEICGQNAVAFAVTVLFSLSTWFFYITHFARQEIFILFFMAAALYAWMKESERKPVQRAVLAAVFTGLAIGFHPNSFLIATTLFFVILVSEDGRFLPLFAYTGVTALLAAVFVGVSYRFGPHFLPNYFAYGAADFGLDAEPVTRLKEFADFFTRLLLRQSGTYYLPASLPGFLLCGFSFAPALYLAIRKRDRVCIRLLAGLFGLLSGLYLVGRYNQLCFVFLLFFVMLLLARDLTFVSAKKQRLSAAVLCVCALLLSIGQITPWLFASSYQTYTESLSVLVPKEAKTLANLNTGFYFDQGKLLDLRNLPYVVLPEGEVTDEESRYEKLEAYLLENEIEYVVYATELDYLYEHRPYYNVIYGNAIFVPALKRFCETNCEETGSFTDPVYGARVMNIFGKETYSRVRVYRVNADAPR